MLNVPIFYNERWMKFKTETDWTNVLTNNIRSSFHGGKIRLLHKIRINVGAKDDYMRNT